MYNFSQIVQIATTSLNLYNFWESSHLVKYVWIAEIIQKKYQIRLFQKSTYWLLTDCFQQKM